MHSQKGSFLRKVGATGFEPATSWSRTKIDTMHCRCYTDTWFVLEMRELPVFSHISPQMAVSSKYERSRLSCVVQVLCRSETPHNRTKWRSEHGKPGL